GGGCRGAERAGRADRRRGDGPGRQRRRPCRQIRSAGGRAMKALTANRLVDGEVVFWRDGAWVEQFAKAQLFDDDAAREAALDVAKASYTTVVEPYLFDVTEHEGIPVPVSYRERLRALGPT